METKKNKIVVFGRPLIIMRRMLKKAQKKPIINIDGPVTLTINGDYFDAWLKSKKDKKNPRRGE